MAGWARGRRPNPGVLVTGPSFHARVGFSPVSSTRIFAARLVGCSVFDPNGDRVGKVRDVLVVYRSRATPRVVGMIVEVPGKRRVFLSIGRITSIGAGQIITTGLINLRRFEQR